VSGALESGAEGRQAAEGGGEGAPDVSVDEAEEGVAGESGLFVATGPHPGPGDSEGGGSD
jgi:hypothetical protein